MIPLTPSAYFHTASTPKIDNTSMDCSSQQEELAEVPMDMDFTDTSANDATLSSVLHNGYPIDLNADLYPPAQLMNDEMKDAVAIDLQEATSITTEIIDNIQDTTLELSKSKRKRTRSHQGKSKPRKINQPSPNKTKITPSSASTSNHKTSSTTKKSSTKSTISRHRPKEVPTCEINHLERHAVGTCAKPLCYYLHKWGTKANCGCGSCAIDIIRSLRECQMCKAREFHLNKDTHEVWFFPLDDKYGGLHDATAKLHLHDFAKLCSILGLLYNALSK
jgi:hypothetical protein